MNLHEADFDKENFEKIKTEIKEIFEKHGIVLPDVEIEFSDEANPWYRPIGAQLFYKGETFTVKDPFIQLAIPSTVDIKYKYPMLAYQLSHEYTHSYIHKYVLSGSANIINELMAESIAHLVLIELDLEWYEKEARNGISVSPKKLYNYIKLRELTAYKIPSEVYKKQGCYLGLIDGKINVWHLVKEFKTILQEQNSESNRDLQYFYDNGFFNLLS